MAIGRIPGHLLRQITLSHPHQRAGWAVPLEDLCHAGERSRHEKIRELVLQDCPEEASFWSDTYDRNDTSLAEYSLRRELHRKRMVIAFQKLSLSSHLDYHDLALLYYALQSGRYCLGTGGNAGIIVTALRDLKVRRISSPNILVLGFSSVYSLENLAALLKLVGFKNANIVALNIALAPLTMAKEEFGGKICGYPISYVKGDARELPFANSSFDLVATHLFLGHFPNNEKKCVLEEAYRVLQKGRDFVDAEIVVEQWFDKAEYIKTFAELGKKFKGTSNERKRAGDYLKKFASFFPFYPYTLSPYFNPGYPYERLFDVSWFIRIKVDLDKQGFVADLHGSNPQALYPGCEARICQIRARKE